MIAKDPSKAQEIKETRRRLLMEHNPNTFTKRKKPEKKPDESGDKVIKKDGQSLKHSQQKLLKNDCHVKLTTTTELSDTIPA